MIKDEECFWCSLYRIKDVTRDLYLFFVDDQRNLSANLWNFHNSIIMIGIAKMEVHERRIFILMRSETFLFIHAFFFDK